MSTDTKPLSIVFFGAGPVAAQSLEFLAGLFHIEAVITKARRPHHHGSTPVLEWCESNAVPAHTPSTKAELSELFRSMSFQSRLGIVIDYGIIIGQGVIDSFPLGILNSHFSLLPEWRGADPITFAVLSGQPITGVSLMLINEKMDEGPLLAQANYEIAADETTVSLTSRLIELSNQLLAATVLPYAQGQILPYEQTSDSISGLKLEPSYSRKLSKQDGILEWRKPAETLERQIRAYIEWPKSHCRLGSVDAVIIQAHVVRGEPAQAPGTIKIAGHELWVSCHDSWLAIDRLKPAGKPEMSAEAFLAGYASRLS